MTRQTLLTSLLACLTSSALGCSIFPDRSPEKVLTSANAYTYYEDRYVQKCVLVVGPPSCKDVQVELKGWKADLKMASDGIKNGGKIPLWLSALKAHEKRVRVLK